MNIFVLDRDPVLAAQLQCDKHVVKMIVESAQMLSTVHRYIDGDVYLCPSKSGLREVKNWRHPDPELDRILYRVVHLKHPCTAWTAQTSCNYEWHFKHFVALCDEYTHRYSRVHETEKKLKEILRKHPKGLTAKGLTPFALAMKANPECMLDDPVESYRAFYKTKLARFSMKWTNREIPEWFRADVYA